MYEEKRRPLKNGDLVLIGGAEYRIESCIGKGTTCLAYRAFLVDRTGKLLDMPVIIKEFYPVSADGDFYVTREKDRLKVSAEAMETDEYKKRMNQFEQGYQSQWNLSCSDETMEIMVRPQRCGDFGGSRYVVTDIHAGTSMDQVAFSSLREKLEAIMAVVDMLQILHDAGYVLVDFKPENILWIPQTKRVKLFDVDSVLKYHELDGIEPEDIRLNTGYLSPQLRVFREIVQNDRSEFANKKQRYLTPSNDIYAAGLLLGRMLFEWGPGEETEIDRDTWKTELLRRYSKELSGKEKLAGALHKILKRALKEQVRHRYGTAQSLLNDLGRVYQALTSEYYVTRKSVARANYSYVSYNMLERFPLFRYGQMKDGVRILDVIIVGSHAMRRQFLQAILSCGQMLDTRLNLRLFDREADQFWEKFTSDESCPELKNVVTCNLNQKMIQMNIDTTIVDRPLAHVYLDTDDSVRHILETAKCCKSGYFLLLGEEETQNVQLAEKILGEIKDWNLCVGCLNNSNTEIQTQNPMADVSMISSLKMSEAYCEKAFESHIYRMGLAVHTYYCKGKNPKAKASQIQEEFRKDLYSVESSERSALHGIYKLASIGIDSDAPDAADQFYNQVLCRKTSRQQELFDRLTALEHRSWTAYMILRGARTVESVEELKRYMYVGGNDWKDRSDPDHIRHPGLRTGLPGRGLPEHGWENLSDLAVNQLDPLDTWSRTIHCALLELVEKEELFRGHKLREIQAILSEEGNREAAEAFSGLERAVLECRKNGKNAEKYWAEARTAFVSVCKENAIWSLRLEEVLLELDRRMRPVIRVSEYHDFKKSDEDVLFALPSILQGCFEKDGAYTKVDQETESDGEEPDLEMPAKSDPEQEIIQICEALRNNPEDVTVACKELEDGTVEVTFRVTSRVLGNALLKLTSTDVD